MAVLHPYQKNPNGLLVISNGEMHEVMTLLGHVRFLLSYQQHRTLTHSERNALNTVLDNTLEQIHNRLITTRDLDSITFKTDPLPPSDVDDIPF